VKGNLDWGNLKEQSIESFKEQLFKVKEPDVYKISVHGILFGWAVTTGPSTGIDVVAPGRQDIILFSGAPTSVWHRPILYLWGLPFDARLLEGQGSGLAFLKRGIEGHCA